MRPALPPDEVQAAVEDAHDGVAVRVEELRIANCELRIEISGHVIILPGQGRGPIDDLPNVALSTGQGHQRYTTSPNTAAPTMIQMGLIVVKVSSPKAVSAISTLSQLPVNPATQPTFFTPKTVAAMS